MTSPLKVEAVSYLNARPLIHTLGQSDRLAIHLSPPAECSARLFDSRADVALIPSIEYPRIRESHHLEIIPDIAIASQGSVRSVELFFKRGLSSIQCVAVDSSSRTSVALLRIVLGEKYDLTPEFISMQPDVNAMLQAADAALIIGDPALELAHQWDNRLDLGEEWADLTDGLPFVYAFWACHSGRVMADDMDIFRRSKLAGTSAIREIATKYAEERGRLTIEDYESYLLNNISFDFADQQKEGLLEFYSYCYYYGLTREIPELRFVGATVSS